MGKGTRTERGQQASRCWCGSAMRLEECHIVPIKAELTADDVRTIVMSVDRRGRCHYPDAPKGCQGGIVRAHTVPRHSLRSIAEQSHVFGFTAEWLRPRPGQSHIEVQRVGINRASVFLGFCQYHDNSLFRSVETGDDFPLTKASAFLIAFRATAREVFNYRNGIAFSSVLRDHARAANPSDWRLEDAETFIAHLSRSAEDVGYHEKMFALEWQSGQRSTIFGRGVLLAKPPDVMCAAMFIPEFDVRGANLENRKTQVPYENVTLYMGAYGKRGICGLFCRDDFGPNARRFVDSFLEQDPERLPSAFVRLAFEVSENTYFRPSWWTTLTEDNRKSLTRRFRRTTMPTEPRRGDAYRDDGRTYASWTVSEVFTL